MHQTYDPLSPEAYPDPYPLYRELRDQSPVYFAKDADVFCVSRYEDALHVLKNTELFSSRAMFTMIFNNGRRGMGPFSWKMLRAVARLTWKTRLNPFGYMKARTLIADDGERHAGMRNLVNRGFTPRRIAQIEARAHEIVASCTADLGHGDRYDVVAGLAIPLPVTLIAELLGVPASLLADFKRWSDAFIDTATGPGRADPFNAHFVEAIIELTNLIGDISRERRSDPRDDLISAIVAEQDGETALNDREVAQFGMLLLIAGNETTTNLIGNAVRALLAHPDELARVKADPSRIPAVVEEVLRYDSPIQVVFRTATRDVELAGTKIPEGAFVMPMLGSANRDERRFADPDRFDTDRDTRGHLGFGFGKHFCLGASLARLEARLALGALIPELERFELVDKEPPLVDSFLVRGPKKLELRAV